MPTLPSIGSRAESSRQFLEADVLQFAELSGDRNPVHLDASFAALTPFKRPIVHGMLVAAQISRILAQELPGPGSIYISQTLQFRRPVFWGDTIRTEVEVTALKPNKNVVILRTTCQKISGEVVLEGEAVIKMV